MWLRWLTRPKGRFWFRLRSIAENGSLELLKLWEIAASVSGARPMLPIPTADAPQLA